MDLDGPRDPEVAASMDIDDDALTCHRLYHCDSAEMNPSSPSGGGMPSDLRSQKHQTVGSVQTPIHSLIGRPSPGSGGSPQLMIPPPPPSPATHLGEMGGSGESHGLARQRWGVLALEPSAQEILSRKRKRTHDSPCSHIIDHSHAQEDGDTFAGGATSQSRRIRPRLWTRQNGEFSPLIYMSPSQEGDSHAEETISAFHCPQNVINPIHTVQRCFHLGNPRVHDPHTSRSGPSPTANGPEDHLGRKRSGSASSFAEVALASATNPKHGRLSTLEDFWLPRPFEGIGQTSAGFTKVHERGFDAGPLFPSTNSGRAGGFGASCEYAGTSSLSRSAMIPLEPSPIKFFDKPLCDSPDSISPTDEGMGSH